MVCATKQQLELLSAPPFPPANQNTGFTYCHCSWLWPVKREGLLLQVCSSFVGGGGDPYVCKYVYVCVCVHVRIYVCLLYIFLCACVCMCCVRACVRACVHACVPVFLALHLSDKSPFLPQWHIPHRIVLPWRTFFIHASTPDDCTMWVDLLRTKTAGASGVSTTMDVRRDS